MDALTQLGVGGIFAVLVIRSFVELVKALKGATNGKASGGHEQITKDTKEITIDTNNKVKTLHSLHSKTNADGLPVWYFPQSIIQDQKEIAKTQADTAVHMKALADAVQKLEEKRR